MNIKALYYMQFFIINDFLNDKKFFIKNNIKFNLNYFNIKNIDLNIFINIYNYLKNNYLNEILIIYCISYNYKIYNLNRYNYINKFNDSFNLIFKYEYLYLINLFYYHLKDANILD